MAGQQFKSQKNKLVREPRNGIRVEFIDESPVKIVQPIVNKDPSPHLDVKVVNCELLNVRRDPSKDSIAIYTIPVNTKLVVEYINDIWAKVLTIDGFYKPGNVMRRFLREVES